MLFFLFGFGLHFDILILFLSFLGINVKNILWRFLLRISKASILTTSMYLLTLRKCNSGSHLYQIVVIFEYPCQSVSHRRFYLKSIRFKNTVTRPSFHSKLWPFSIQQCISWHQNKVSWCIIENGHSFVWNENRVTVFLKWTDFNTIFSIDHAQECWRWN